MKMKMRLEAGLLLIFLLLGCGPRLVATPPDLPAAPAVPSIPPGLTREQFNTLSSLQKVDDYPLYTMTYGGAYRLRAQTTLLDDPSDLADSTSAWACSLFAVLLDRDNLLYGRNFDWEFSPALLLFTDPPEGYASVSMVDVTYLGFVGQAAANITDLPVEERTDLLEAPALPFDGMNEHGLAIGMAAVPPGNMKPDPNKERIGSLGIIRQMLDHARTVGEAVEMMKQYNIDFSGGPPVHYLMADATGKSVLVEYYDGKMRVLNNNQPWHLATNFLLSSVEDPADGGCWRYNKMSAKLSETGGQMDPTSAMQLLAGVAQSNTQWSVVYQMSIGIITVAMGGQYQQIHQFQLELLTP
jgi:choloylglycine hydrolase